MALTINGAKIMTTTRLVITVVQQNPGGTLFGDTIGANGAGTISDSWGNVASHIDWVADNGDPFTVNFTNGMFVGDQIWATVTVDLGLAGVAPIVSNVQLARQHGTWAASAVK